MGYTKLFSSILASSVWQEELPTKVVWVTMLALKNERHEVEASLPGLAKLAGVSLEECQKAIAKFEAPDTYSRSPANEGRKIERCEAGWRILNGEYYQKLLSAEERREYCRVKQAEYRKRRKGNVESAKEAGAQQAMKEGFHQSSPTTESAQETRPPGVSEDGGEKSPGDVTITRAFD